MGLSSALSTCIVILTATPVKGRPPRGSEIGHDGGSRVIQSHASFYPSESTTQRRTSLCHATCEKRGSEVAAHAGTVWC